MRHRHVGSLVVVERADNGYRPTCILTDDDIVVEVIAEGLSAYSVPGHRPGLTRSRGDAIGRGIRRGARGCGPRAWPRRAPCPRARAAP
jgi:hypothetical protein